MKHNSTPVNFLQLVVRQKQAMFVWLSIGYILVVSIMRWGLNFTFDTALFIAGGVIGIYLLDAVELFLDLKTPPFHTIIFLVSFAIVSLFVVSSSASIITVGLVLTMYISLLAQLVGEWKVLGNHSSWYRMVAVPVSIAIQRLFFVGFILLFVIETIIFIL